MLKVERIIKFNVPRVVVVTTEIVTLLRNPLIQSLT
jgi:hypothetical protein